LRSIQHLGVHLILFYTCFCFTKAEAEPKKAALSQ
jgi:hypothetical protein